MLLPDNFKGAIGNTFYDKTISVLGKTQTVETDGAVNNTIGAVTGTFQGNCRLIDFKQVQKEFGLDYQIDITITCEVGTSVAIGDLIAYENVKYTVTDVLSFDSHTLIVGAKWRQPNQ